MKPGTFTQLYVQLVFAVRNREAALNRNIRKRVFEYMSGIITEMKHKSIIVNGVSDHVHLFIDETLKESARLAFHPNVNTASVVISKNDFLKFLNHTGNTFEFISLYE